MGHFCISFYDDVRNYTLNTLFFVNNVEKCCFGFKIMLFLF